MSAALPLSSEQTPIGENDRIKVSPWVPRWMAFPPSSYTARGGVSTVGSASRAQGQAEADAQPELERLAA